MLAQAHFEVGDFEDALLDALQFVARIRQHQHEEEIHHIGDNGFRLPDADRLHEDDVIACRLAQQHRLPRLARHAAQRLASRRGADEGVLIRRQLRHACLVAQDRSARATRGWIDSQHGHLLSHASEQRSERLDKGGLAHAGHARDPDALRPSRLRHDPGQQHTRFRLMVRPPGLDQSDGAAKTGAGGKVSLHANLCFRFDLKTGFLR